VSVVKWVITVVAGMLGVASLGWALLQVPEARAAVEPAVLRPLELRAFPGTRTVKVSAASPEDEPEPLGRAASLDGGSVSDGGRPQVPVGRPDAGTRGGPAVPPLVGEGTLDLAASDTADIYLDGKKVGSSPMRGVKVRSGNHKVRFDCYDAAGNAVTGSVKVLAVAPDQAVEVKYPCPESQ
jgi:hypothetical protein